MMVTMRTQFFALVFYTLIIGCATSNQNTHTSSQSESDSSRKLAQISPSIETVCRKVSTQGEYVACIAKYGSRQYMPMALQACENISYIYDQRNFGIECLEVIQDKLIPEPKAHICLQISQKQQLSMTIQCLQAP